MTTNLSETPGPGIDFSERGRDRTVRSLVPQEFRRGARPKAVAFDIIDTVFSLEALRPALEAHDMRGEDVETLYAAMLRDAISLGAAGGFAPLAEVMGGAPEELMPVAAHAWDCHGAKRIGMTAGFVRRGQDWPGVFDRPDVSGEELIRRRRSRDRYGLTRPLLPNREKVPAGG